MLMKSSELFACEHMCLHVRVHVHTHTHTHTHTQNYVVERTPEEN